MAPEEPTRCARCGAIVEGENCPQCGLARGAPAWEPPAGAAPYGAPPPSAPEQPPTAAEPQPPAPPQQYGVQQQWVAPGPQLPPGDLAGWWRRVGASLLDNLLVVLASALIFLLVWVMSGDTAAAAVSAYAGYLTISLLLYGLVYAPFFMKRDETNRDGTRNGQTLGKQVMGIRVVRLDGQPMNYRTGALREWVARTLLFQLAGAFLFGLPALLDYLWPLWDNRNQSLHDKIASTVVMRV